MVKEWKKKRIEGFVVAFVDEIPMGFFQWFWRTLFKLFVKYTLLRTKLGKANRAPTSSEADRP